MSVVLKEFLYAADGHTITRMYPGMECDFGALTVGLMADGLIAEESGAETATVVTQVRPSQGRGRRKDENQPRGDDAGV